MKLKKIVSLALAGILAVSMLAGCKDNSSSSSTPTPNEPTTPNVVSAVENAIARENAGLTISVTTNNSLDKAMKNFDETFEGLVVDVDNADIVKILNGVFYSNINAHNIGYKDQNMVKLGDMSKEVNADSVTTGTKYYYGIYSYGTVSESSCLTQAANSIADSMKNVENTFNIKDDNKNYTVNNVYTMYVYEGSVENNSNGTEPYVIAVLKVKTEKNIVKG